jgi:hypothetical protein
MPSSTELVMHLFYPVFLLMAFMLTLIFIPRKDYKNYLIYGFLIGGSGDIFTVGIMQNLLHVMWFKNQGIFYVLGHIALSPPCWTLSVMIFLYFLPARPWVLYLYILTWAAYSLGFGYLVHNINLFDFLPWFYPVPAYLIFLSWWSFAAWLFIRTSPLADYKKK